MALKNKVIINVSIGSEESWYHKGTQRLLESLDKFGEKSDRIFTKKDTYEYGSPYADKMIAIHDAWMNGYREILYLDCSLTALKPLDELWNIIDDKGYYLYESGMNCAQTCNDNSLSNFGITRDLAASYNEAATNVIGINGYEHFGQKIVMQMKMRVEDGSVFGKKWPNEQERLKESKDNRFLFHRQDQSVISLIAGQYNMEIFKNDFVWRDENENKQTNKNIFRLKGGY